MSRSWIAAVVVVALAGPAAALAGNAPPTAAALANQTCKGLQTSLGVNFAPTYHTFGGCVSKTIHASQSEIQSAEKTCKGQQTDATFASTHGGKTFDQFFGGNGKGKGADANAYGKCVSQTAKALADARVKNTTAAAKQCRLQRKNDPGGFATSYGTGKNAFGKCVAKTTKAP